MAGAKDPPQERHKMSAKERLRRSPRVKDLCQEGKTRKERPAERVKGSESS